MNIHKNDEVLVITGKDRGKRGRVLRVFRSKGKVQVENVNIVTRHLKRNPQNPGQGGRIQRSAPIAVSNVMVWSDADSRAVRIRHEGKGGAKRRVSSLSGSELTSAARSKARRAARKEPKES